MKKLILLTLPLLFLAGCSLTSNQPTETSEETTAPAETSPIVSSIFDSSEIVLEWTEISFEWYHRYKDILDFNNWSIWIQMGGQDWYEISLIYTENGEIVKTSNPILWYDRRYTDKNINEYCVNKPGFQSLDKCTLVKTIDSCVSDKNTWNATDCVNKAFEYVFNLIQWNEINNYFTQEFENFKNSL